MQDTKERLISEYIKLSGENPSPEIYKLVDSVLDTEAFFTWEKKANEYKLIEIDPFGLPEENLNFGHDSKADTTKYVPTVFDSLEEPQGEVKDNVPTLVSHKRALMKILPDTDRKNLLSFHDPADFNSSNKVLDGFGIDRLLECYAEEIGDETIARYLNLRPSQLKRWIAISDARIISIKKLKHIMRSKNIDKTVDEGFDFQPGEVYDKETGMFENIRLGAMKMKVKLATDLEAKSAVVDNAEAKNLPIVNIQFNLKTDVTEGDTLEDIQIKPVAPFITHSEEE